MRFKSLSGDKPQSVIQELANLLAKDHSGKIYIGTDSQNAGPNTNYATVIAFRYSFGRGAKVYFKIEKTTREKDLGVRLTKEASLTIECAEWIRDNSSIKIEALEMDLNSDPKHKSHPYLSSLKGWGEGLGFTVIVKPNEQCACKAANELCR